MKTAIVFLALLVTAIPAFSQGTVWKQDPAHSQVKFSVSHMVIAEVTGRFKDFDVALQQGKEDFTDSKIDATIKTASIDTDNENRDKHLRGDDFLNAEKFPALTFRSTSFEKTGKETYKITGNLTIRDVTKLVVLDAKLNGVMKDPWGNIKAGFKATTTINRMDFGAKWNKVLEAGGLLVGENVDITLLMELAKQ